MALLGLFLALWMTLPCPPAGAQAHVQVFFPSGSQAFLIGADSVRILQSGSELSCQPGIYQLRIQHLDYEAFEQTIELSPEARLLLIPQLQLARTYLSEQQLTVLERERQKVHKSRALARINTLGSAALCVASLLAAGVLEGVLAYRKQELDGQYERYLTAPAAEAPAIWADIEASKENIGVLRAWESGALLSAGVTLSSGLLSLLLRPSTEDLDRRIRALREGGAE